jgi:hypothetical protein
MRVARRFTAGTASPVMSVSRNATSDTVRAIGPIVSSRRAGGITRPSSE